jgi:hypothetical protein
VGNLPMDARERVASDLPVPSDEPSLCPNCAGKDIRRSRRQGFFERYLLPVARLRPYRCDDCDQRFYAKRRRNCQNWSE